MINWQWIYIVGSSLEGLWWMQSEILAGSIGTSFRVSEATIENWTLNETRWRNLDLINWDDCDSILARIGIIIGKPRNARIINGGEWGNHYIFNCSGISNSDETKYEKSAIRKDYEMQRTLARFVVPSRLSSSVSFHVILCNHLILV